MKKFWVITILLLLFANTAFAIKTGDLNVFGGISLGGIYYNTWPIVPTDINGSFASILDFNRVKLDQNKMFESILDLNQFFYRKTDVNGSFSSLLDLNRVRLDANAMFHSRLDLNMFYYKKTDVNGSFCSILDLNAYKLDANTMFESILDFNAHKADTNANFVGYQGANKDLNMATKDIYIGPFKFDWNGTALVVVKT